MNEPRNNVFARTALPLDQHRNIGAGQFGQAVADGLHGFGASKNDRIRRHLSQRLNKRAYAADCHDFFLPSGGESSATLQLHPENQKALLPFGGRLKVIYLIDYYQLTQEIGQRDLSVRG